MVSHQYHGVQAQEYRGWWVQKGAKSRDFFGSVADVCCPFRLLPSLPLLRDHQSCYKHQNGSDKLGARQGQAQSLQRGLGPSLTFLPLNASPLTSLLSGTSSLVCGGALTAITVCSLKLPTARMSW